MGYRHGIRVKEFELNFDRRMKMENPCRYYTPQEVFEIEKEAHRLCSPLDEDADQSIIFCKETPLYEWRHARNFLEWDELCLVQNRFYGINASREDWLKAIMPEFGRVLWDYCVFVARHAKKEIIQPVTICGKECKNAAVFFSIKNNMQKVGLDISDLRPSTNISTFLTHKDFSKFIIVLLKTGKRVFDVFEEDRKEGLSLWQRINVFDPNRYYINTGHIKTFKDLSRKITGD